MRLILIVVLISLPVFAQSSLEAVRRGFQSPPDDARIMMRWWWFGSAVTKPELERELRTMRQGGIGGVEIQPVYPLMLDDPARGFRNVPYLSDEYLDDLSFTSRKARELGLRMDVTLGSGWPFGGPHVAITEAAGRLRCDRVPVLPGTRSVPVPAMEPGEKLIATFLARGDQRRFEAAGMQRMDRMESGRLLLPESLEGPHVVLFFIASRTGMQVKRPAVGAEGFVLDHYDRHAIEHHLSVVGEKLMKAFRDHPPYSVFSDSLEVFASDWTPDLIEEFRKRRGYDLTPYLPALIADFGDKTAQVRRDWGRTLTELAEERYLTPIREWAHKHGTLFRSQTYGTPPVLLSSNALVDLPEGEAGPYWRKFSTARWASSASHLYRRQVTSSETWTWLHSPAFRATPLDMKAEADLHFLQGINQLIGHGWPYSPEIAGEPGWRFYAAAVFNHHNPWWPAMPGIAKYLQRVSYLMRQGLPASDVALYLPTEDAYAQFTAGHDSVDRAMDALLGPNIIPQILDAGFNFDFIDDAAIEKVGVSHPVLVMPEVKYLPPDTARRLDDYKRKGGIVVEAKAGGAELGAALARAFTPDFAARNPAIGFVHRHLDDADIYFVVNTGNRPVETMAVVRTRATQAQWWNPLNAEFTAAQLNAGRLSVALQPYESRVLVLSNSGAPLAASVSRPELARIDLSSGWSVTFPGVGAKEMPQLRSWSEDEDTKYFSGQAEYEKRITIPPAMLKPGTRVYLNLGSGTVVRQTGRTMGFRALLESPVREAATVVLNGTEAGTVWCPPYEIEITKYIHAGENVLRIKVGNLAINMMAGQSPPDYKLLNLRYGERFTPQDMNNLQPLPAGLLGPVALIAL
jgi:hypothetical protein